MIIIIIIIVIITDIFCFICSYIWYVYINLNFIYGNFFFIFFVKFSYIILYYIISSSMRLIRPNDWSTLFHNETTACFEDLVCE